jgi:hypothetical protein
MSHVQQNSGFAPVNDFNKRVRKRLEAERVGTCNSSTVLQIVNTSIHQDIYGTYELE